MMRKFFLLFITVTGIVTLYWSCCILKQSQDALHWPQTTGNIISSSLSIDHLPKFIDSRDDPFRWYGTEIQYEYSVGDERYLSNRLSFLKGGTINPKEALKVMNKYRRQHEVPVYYDPKYHKEAVLQPGVTMGDIYIPLLIGGLLTLLGLVYLYPESLECEAENLIHKGNIYQKKGKFEDSLWEYNEFIKDNPNLALGYTRRGSIYLQQENWDKAIADFNKATMFAPDNGLAYFNLANAYLGKMEYDRAWVYMQKAREMGFKVSPKILENIKKKLG
jgi:tetratricopeptide (TPR) repeat protein